MSSDTDNSDIDPTFVLGNEDSCSDGLHLSSSDTEDNIPNIDGQDNNDLSDLDGPESDCEETYDNIPEFSFDVNSSGVKLDIPNGASAFDVFSLIWDDKVMNLILKASNEYGKKFIIPKDHIQKILVQKITMKFQL